jgi:signal transduction histidine kinase/ActR/RegA family two-component response regulator
MECANRIDEWQLAIWPPGCPSIPAAATLAAEREDGALMLRWLIRDVSERKRQQQVVAERDSAQEASRAKDEFLAILSHELRNPLMPVIGWARMLKDHPAAAQDSVLAEGLRSLDRNAQILGRLVGDCLDMSRIAEGKIELERQTLDLNQAVRGSLEAIQEMAANKALTLAARLGLGPIPVFADVTRLEQVIMNLLVNAVKYTDRCGQIVITSGTFEGSGGVDIRDTGAGIHPAFLEQIFEPFRRGAGSQPTHEPGLGLGLAIARRIVEMHGGRIWAESPGPGCGSSFHVRIPLAAPPATQTARKPVEASIQNPPLKKTEARELAILLIEDSDDILFLLKIEMERAGHTVISATDGAAGLALAKATHPDLIISDIKMPRMDGYELIREIRSCADIRDTPVVALTGLGAKLDIDRAIAAGFDACIMKPAHAQEVVALIQRLAERDFPSTPGRDREPQ